MPNENSFLEKALLVQVETTKVRRILNFENSFEEFRDLARSAGANVLEEIKELNKLPVVNFAAGGIATPADAALMMQLGCDGVFVGSGIFKSGDPAERAEAIVIATTNYSDPKVLSEVSKDLGEPMVGINIDTLSEEEKLAKRGW